MKKDFFEIMKNYDPEIKSFSVSSKNIKEKTMSKINVPQKRFKFAKRFSFVPIVITACITTVVGVTAYELSTLDRAVQFYEEHPHASQTINTEDKEVLNDLLKAETAIVESNGATMELTGSMYDENKMLLFFKLTAPENTILNQEYCFWDDMFHHNSDSTGGASGKTYFNDTNKTDNITYFTYEIDCNGFKAQEFTDIHFENLCLAITDKHRNIRIGPPVVEGEWLMPLNLSTPSESVHLLDESIKIYNPERYYRVYDIKISSLTLSIEASYELSNVDISVIMKDGSIINEVMGEGGGSSENGFSNIYSFGKPINLSEVKSIKLNDTEISVEDKYNEKFGIITEATEPDTTGMTEIYAEKINIFATDDIILLDSIKMDHEKLIIGLTSNTLQDTMTIHMKDKTKSEKILFGNGIDTNGDGIYTEAYYFDKPLNPEDVEYIEIENTGLRLEVSAYMNNN